MRSQMKMAKTMGTTNDIDSKIVPVSNIPVDLKVLVYGRSGTGKTTFVGTAPKPLLLLDVREQGTASIRQSPDTYVYPIERWDDFEAIYWYLMNNKGQVKFRSVAIDSVTQLQELAIQKVIGGDSGGTASKRAWGEVSGLLKTWIVMFRDLPLNVIFTAQDRLTVLEEESEDDEGIIVPEVGPYLMPSVAKTLNGAVGVIGQTFIRERSVTTKTKSGKEKVKQVVEFCLRIGPHARYTTKLRRDPRLGSEGDVPAVLISPTFDQIAELSIGEEV